MNYTKSDASVVHEATGHRMHQSILPITTEVSADDMNMVIWSLMAVLESAGVPAADFDPNNPATYTKLLEALGGVGGGGGSGGSSVLAFGATGDGATDDLAAVLAAKIASPYVHFPRVNNLPTTYVIGGFSAGQLDGMIVSAAEGVTISFASNAPYSLYKSIFFLTDVAVNFRDINVKHTFKRSPLTTSKDSLVLPGPPSPRKRTPLNGDTYRNLSARTVTWPGSDVFTETVGALRNIRQTYFNASALGFKGPFIELSVYETVSAYFESGETPGPIGVIVRGTAGFCIVYSNGAAGNYYLATKLTGQPVSGNTASLTWDELGQGV